ncbi:PadR family transcriptional regulator [Paenibacillus xylaniclasticus]|uniref:PadR family transcriptional regulator n=1 Tax=Paenibacillus xylaniclasticus TaxID=588083 RepID=UPI000FD980EB|nr:MULTISPECIES: PadR family transcriptional regulator [Paenibacillus]GFN30826.1 transcriptional regulator [Paenibacillus curdlanolyticus]
MSSMKLLILGLLMEGDKHPYEIRQTIKARSWDESFKLRDGSLYYAVDQLREDGLIEAAKVVPVPGDNRPDKTIFRITDQGKTIFQKMLHKQLRQQAYPQHPVFMALPFIRHGDPDTIISLLEAQIATCDARHKRLTAALELKGSYLPGGTSHMLEGFIRFSETERQWLEQLVAAARSGKLFEGPKWSPELLEAYNQKMRQLDNE